MSGNRGERQVFVTINQFRNEEGNIKYLKVINGIYKMTIRIGDEFVAIPDNKLKLKHRNRIFKVTGFVKDSLGNVIKVKVRFQDNNRAGRIDVDDIKPLKLD